MSRVNIKKDCTLKIQSKEKKNIKRNRKTLKMLIL